MLVFLFSCTPAPAPVQAFKVLDGTAITVDNCMKALGDFYRAGKINDIQKDEIIKIYEVYRIAAQAANTVIKTWYQASPNATDTPPEVTKALNDVNTKATSVLTIAKLYGVK